MQRKLSDLYLVTNWHVLSGRHATSGKPLDRATAAVPNIAVVWIRSKDKHGFPEAVKVMLSTECEKPFWRQHPKGQLVDLAYIKLPDIDRMLDLTPQSHNSQKLLAKAVGSDCFVVGYPLSKISNSDFPIWKRGTIASEFDYGHNTEGTFLVDTTTSSGMSGSPVYVRQNSNIKYADGTSFIGFDSATEFVGIYSGRIMSANDGTLDLGLVWKADLVYELLWTSVEPEI